MTFPTVTETTPRPEAVTRDTFLASDLDEGAAMRAREAAAIRTRRPDCSGLGAKWSPVRCERMLGANGGEQL